MGSGATPQRNLIVLDRLEGEPKKTLLQELEDSEWAIGEEACKRLWPEGPQEVDLSKAEILHGT